MAHSMLPAAHLDAHDPGREAHAWWTLAAVAIFIRIVIMPYGGFPVDIGTFRAWAVALAENGPAAFYGAGFADYLPGYLYVLWLIGAVNQVVRFNDQAFLFALKLPAAVSDVATGWLLYLTARRLGSRWALGLAATYLFNPGIIFNSSYWGQADAVAAVFVVGGVASLAAAASPIVTGVLMTIAAVIKPQTAPAMIPVGLYLLRRLSLPGSGPPRWDVLLGAAVASLATLVLLMLPFGLSPVGLVGVLRTSLSVYPYSSVVAFNFWGAVQGFWMSDGVRWLGLPLYALGAAATALGLLLVGGWSWRARGTDEVAYAAALALLISFMVPTRIHERYLLAAIPLFALLAGIDRRAIPLYALLSLTFGLNLLYAYTRPYVETFALPPLIENTLYAGWGARVLAAIAACALPWAAVLMITWRRRARARSTIQTTSGG